MSIVYVNDWNGYGGGIFGSFEDALEEMAIFAVGKGIEKHQEEIEDLEYLAEPLAAIGFGGSRADRNLYLLVTSEIDTEMYSIRTHDTKTRPGHSSQTITMVSDEMFHPAFEIQKALYELAGSDLGDIDAIKDRLVALFEEKIADVMDGNAPAAALDKLRGNGIPNFASAIGERLFEGVTEDPSTFLDSLPQRAGDLFTEIAGKVFDLDLDALREKLSNP
jgi:hypothetical protein